MTDNNVFDSFHVEKARQLVKHMEAQNLEGVSRILKELTEIRHNKLFCELGRLTRELHETLNSFRVDNHIASLAENDIPDAKKRLGHVIHMTETSALRTLTAVENSMPLSRAMHERTQHFKISWQSFRRREMTAEQFRRLSRDMDEFLEYMGVDISQMQDNLSEILLAQEAQDLSGQIIKQVIDLVADLEVSLVELIRITGGADVDNSLGDSVATEEDRTVKAQNAVNTLKASGPVVPGLESADVMQSQDEVDELLSSLGF